MAGEIINYGARIYSDKDIGVPPEYELALSFNCFRYNDGGVYNPAENTRLTATVGGVYIITAQVIWGVASQGIGFGDLGTMWQLTIKLNGVDCLATDRQGGNTVSPFNHCTTIWKMGMGDYVEAVVSWWSDTNDPLLLCKARRALHLDSPEFMMQRLG